jgi:hypothetical protein
MPDPEKPDLLSDELATRLNDLFREDGPTDSAVPKRPVPAVSAAPPRRENGGALSELKKLVLSIDWEITPQVIDSFLEQVDLLKARFRDDKPATVLLQLLATLGQYIKSSRSNVHPSTFPLLNSVFARLDEFTGNPGLSEAAKRRLLQTEVEAYQGLRTKIAQRRTPEPPSRSASAPAPPAGVAGAVTPAALAQAVQELKAYIHAEIEALRRELRGTPRR